MKNGKCPAGEYYCYTDKKCKPIPKGFMVDPKGMLRKENGHTVDEANKSGDSSLRDWFGKSKSSDGKPGWVQLGGKYAGKPCAKQPGQTTKPKCGSSKMKRNLSKDEEERAFRRKNRQDPNPNRKGKAINVATEETKKDHEFSMARSELSTIKNAAKRLNKKMGKKGEGELKAWVQSKITKAADYIDTAADYVTNEENNVTEMVKKKGQIRVTDVGNTLKKSVDNQINTDPTLKLIKKKMGNPPIADEFVPEAAGEKDACYHKVKSRYSVWPSAYASGALVKCRKVGAKNWGNKSKKNEEFTPSQIAALESIGAIDVNEEGQKCWKGYEKKGTKKMFGKTYNNCVKKEDVELTDAYGETFAVIQDIVKPEPIKSSSNGIEFETYDIEKMTEAVRMPTKTGQIVKVHLSWRGKYYAIKMFFPSIKTPSRSDVQLQIDKVYPGARIQSYQVSEYEPGEPVFHTEGAAWTKKEGKNKEGGLNEKGRKSYERENPGSDLKAPSKKVGNPRRASFCARMKGMKKKLTSKKTANDPDSRINKSLRAWNC